MNLYVLISNVCDNVQPVIIIVFTNRKLMYALVFNMLLKEPSPEIFLVKITSFQNTKIQSTMWEPMTNSKVSITCY